MGNNKWDEDKNRKLITTVAIVAMVAVLGCIVAIAFSEKNKRMEAVNIFEESAEIEKVQAEGFIGERM